MLQNMGTIVSQSLNFHLAATSKNAKVKTKTNFYSKGRNTFIQAKADFCIVPATSHIMRQCIPAS